MFSVIEVQKWSTENAEDLTESLVQAREENPDKFNSVNQTHWNAGQWLKETLDNIGATQEECEAACFAHRQRSFNGDSTSLAVSAANEFETSKDK